MALEEKDVLVNARTGSGKPQRTCCRRSKRFCLQRSLQESPCSLYSCRHSRSQNSAQVAGCRRFDLLLPRCALLSGTCGRDCGGAGVWLRENPDIVVATPARLRVHLDANFSGTESIDTIVVDEADLVLSFGHKQTCVILSERCQRLAKTFSCLPRSMHRSVLSKGRL